MSPGPSRTIRGYELLQQALKRAAEEPGYRARLHGKDTARAALKEAGLEVPDDVELVVHENTPDEVHLVLPSSYLDWEQLDIEEVDVRLIIECGF